MTISCKLRKKKVVFLAVPIIKKKEKLYAEIHHLNQNIIDINHALFQISKQELAKIF